MNDEVSKEELKELMAEELEEYLKDMRELMKRIHYADKNYDPRFMEVVNFALSQNIILLSKNVNDVLQSGGKLHLNKSYLSGLRVLSDLFSTLNKNQAENKNDNLEDPLVRLRKSLKIEEIKS